MLERLNLFRELCFCAGFPANLLRRAGVQQTVSFCNLKRIAPSRIQMSKAEEKKKKEEELSGLADLQALPSLQA